MAATIGSSSAACATSRSRTAEGFDHGGVDTVSIRDSYAASLKAELGNLSPDGLATFVLGDKVGVALPAGFNPFVQQIHPAIENIDLLGSVGAGRGGRRRVQPDHR